MDTPLLTSEQQQQYERYGYIVIPKLLTDEEVDSFVEYERKPKPEGWRQNLRHHADDTNWSRIARHPRVVGIARELLQGEPMIVQTMYMEKQPAAEADVGGAGVALHQDLHYLPCEPETLMACWIAFSDTDPENGGLCVVPGSHATRGLYTTQKNENTKDHDSWEIVYKMSDRDGRRWREHMYSFNIDGIGDDDIVRLTIPKGAGVFFTGKTIHGSFANRSRDRVRRAFATHYVAEGTWVFREDVQKLVPA